MQTLYDKIINAPGIDPKIIKGLEESEVVFIDNVSQYFFLGNEKEEWDILNDFPNIAPPFSDMYFEFQSPKAINSGGVVSGVEVTKGHDIRAGLLFHSTDLRDVEEKEYEKRQKEWPGLRWSTEVLLFRGVDGHLQWYEGWPFFQAWNMGINEHGQIWRKSDDNFLLALRANPKLYEKNELYREGVKVQGRNFMRCELDVALLAISFMHCKNVEIVPRGQGSYKGKRNRHKPSFRYHVLEIEPMKKVLRTEGESEKTGLKRALHICRGHFKDFTKGKGLFGRYKDIYWWDSQVRGDIAYGLVNKDYAVKSPIVQEK